MFLLTGVIALGTVLLSWRLGNVATELSKICRLLEDPESETTPTLTTLE